MAHLRQADPRLGEWIDRIGVLQFPPLEAREPYLALLETIAHQQLAGAAPRAIWTRVTGLCSVAALFLWRIADSA